MCQGNRMTHTHAGVSCLCSSFKLSFWHAQRSLTRNSLPTFYQSLQILQLHQTRCWSSLFTAMCARCARWSLWKVKATAWSVLTLHQTNHARKLWRASMATDDCKNDATHLRYLRRDLMFKVWFRVLSWLNNHVLIALLKFLSLRSIRPSPGQPSMRMGDLLVSVNGRSLALTNEVPWLGGFGVCFIIPLIETTKNQCQDHEHAYCIYI